MPNGATCPGCSVELELVAADANDPQGDYYLKDDLAYCRYTNSLLYQ